MKLEFQAFSIERRFKNMYETSGAYSRKKGWNCSLRISLYESKILFNFSL